MSSRFEEIGREVVYEGRFITVEVRTFRHEDGEEATREIVTHPGAVGVVVLDGDDLWLVRQPREAIGSPDLLELPAGKLDEEVHLYLATGISDVDERPSVEEDERIDVEVRPVSELDAILGETKDAKTLIGLMMLRERRRA